LANAIVSFSQFSFWRPEPHTVADGLGGAYAEVPARTNLRVGDRIIWSSGLDRLAIRKGKLTGA